MGLYQARWMKLSVGVWSGSFHGMALTLQAIVTVLPRSFVNLSINISHLS